MLKSIFQKIKKKNIKILWCLSLPSFTIYSPVQAMNGVFEEYSAIAKTERFPEFNRLIPDIQQRIIADFVQSRKSNFDTVTLVCKNWKLMVCSSVNRLRPAFYSPAYWEGVEGRYVTLNTSFMKSKWVLANRHRKELEKQHSYATLWEAGCVLSRFPNLIDLDLGSCEIKLSGGWNFYESVMNVLDQSVIILPSSLRRLVLNKNEFIKDTHVSALTNLTELGLKENTSITDKGVNFLTKLGHLDITDNTLITDGSLGRLQNLRVLRLGKNLKISDLSLEFLTNLIELYTLGNPRITDKSMRFLTKMQTLSITECPFISDLGIMNMIHLTGLSVSGNSEVSDESVKVLTNLTDLLIDNCPSISDESMRYLTNLTTLHIRFCPLIIGSNMKYLPRLTNLHLCHSNVTNENLKLLRNLSSLSLVSDNIITDLGVKFLANITTLDLSWNSLITDKSLKLLTRLTSLDLMGNDVITYLGLEPLSNLTYLNLVGSNITSSDFMESFIERSDLIELIGFNDREKQLGIYIENGHIFYESTEPRFD